jgi:hypothetical protein
MLFHPHRHRIRPALPPRSGHPPPDRPTRPHTLPRSPSSCFSHTRSPVSSPHRVRLVLVLLILLLLIADGCPLATATVSSCHILSCTSDLIPTSALLNFEQFPLIGTPLSPLFKPPPPRFLPVPLEDIPVSRLYSPGRTFPLVTARPPLLRLITSDFLRFQTLPRTTHPRCLQSYLAPDPTPHPHVPISAKRITPQRVRRVTALLKGFDL